MAVTCQYAGAGARYHLDLAAHMSVTCQSHVGYKSVTGEQHLAAALGGVPQRLVCKRGACPDEPRRHLLEMLVVVLHLRLRLRRLQRQRVRPDQRHAVGLRGEGALGRERMDASAGGKGRGVDANASRARLPHELGALRVTGTVPRRGAAALRHRERQCGIISRSAACARAREKER